MVKWINGCCMLLAIRLRASRTTERPAFTAHGVCCRPWRSGTPSPTCRPSVPPGGRWMRMDDENDESWVFTPNT